MPDLYSIIPDSSSTLGGSTVLLSGLGLNSLTGVLFGSNAATGVVPISSSKAICIVPASTSTIDNRVGVTLQFSSVSKVFSNRFTYYNMTEMVGLQAYLNGYDISQYVTSWGNLEQVRELMLATPQVFTSEVSLSVYNFNNFLSPAGQSLMKGLTWFNTILELKVYGYTLFKGLLIDLPVKLDDYTVEIKARSFMNVLATRNFSGTGTSNPGDLLFAIVNSAIPQTNSTVDNATDYSKYVDYNSLLLAGADTREAGATIKYEFSGNDTCLSAIQKISELCSIEVYLYGFQIVARPFRAIDPNINVKAELLNDFVQEWQSLESNFLSFYNRVTVGYPTSNTLTLNDYDSQRTNKNIIDYAFDETAAVAAADYASAEFFGNLFLSRNSKRRAKLNVLGKSDYYQLTTGDRLSVTQPQLGYVQKPFEIVEVHHDLDNKGYQLSLVEL